MTKSKPEITQELVRRLYDYDPETGILSNRCDRSRTSKIGTRVGFVDVQGYRCLKINSRKYMSSRIIWLWMTGAWPKEEMDHANIIRDDDRWCNLREASRSQNCANKGRFYKKNRLGFRGVRVVSKGKYAAVVCVGQKEKFIGPFPTLELAALAYDVAAKERHGEFARFNFTEKIHRDWLLVPHG